MRILFILRQFFPIVLVFSVMACFIWIRYGRIPWAVLGILAIIFVLFLLSLLTVVVARWTGKEIDEVGWIDEDFGEARRKKLSTSERTKQVIESIMYIPPHSFPPDDSIQKHYNTCPYCGSKDIKGDWSEQAPWETWYSCKNCGRSLPPD